MLQSTAKPESKPSPELSRVARHPLAEHYGSLLRSARGRDERDTPRTMIGLTSVRSGAGVTTVTLNLAWRAVSESLNVLVVDLNRSRQDLIVQLGGRRKAPGFLDYVHAETDLADCLQETHSDRLQMMACGRTSGSVSPDMARHVLNELSERFDLILFDLPPASEAGPWQAFAPSLEAVLLVLEADREDRRELSETRRRLAEAGIEITGAVWNKHRAR